MLEALRISVLIRGHSRAMLKLGWGGYSIAWDGPQDLYWEPLLVSLPPLVPSPQMHDGNIRAHCACVIHNNEAGAPFEQGLH